MHPFVCCARPGCYFMSCLLPNDTKVASPFVHSDLQSVSRIFWHLAVKGKSKKILFCAVKCQTRTNEKAEPQLCFGAIHHLTDRTFYMHLCICSRLAGVYWCSPSVCSPCFISISNSFSIWKSITSLLSEKQDQSLAPLWLTLLRSFVLIEDGRPRSILKRGLVTK